jgi:hypothetical protein
MVAAGLGGSLIDPISAVEYDNQDLALRGGAAAPRIPRFD